MVTLFVTSDIYLFSEELVRVARLDKNGINQFQKNDVSAVFCWHRFY